MTTRASRIADELLFPAAAEVDEKGKIPGAHFDALAEEGFYALAVPAELGGPGLAPAEAGQILESLAGGCLTTTFTWLQHHSLVLGLLGTQNAELGKRYLGAATRGELRGGIATAGAIPPKSPKLTAKPVSGGFVINGEAPFVSGWGIVDMLYIAARDGDTVINGLVEAQAGNHISAEPLDLIAAAGTKTVRLHFTDYYLPAEMVTGQSAYADFVAGLAFGVRFNAALPLGLVERCARLLAEAGYGEAAQGLRQQRDTTRDRLDYGLANDADTLFSARAEAAELAVRSGTALVTAAGSGAVLRGEHSQRLLREATFTLVAGTRPAIKDKLIGLLT